MTNTIRLKITCFLLLFTVLLIKDILDLAWHLATRMKFGTCEQNWDLYGTISGPDMEFVKNFTHPDFQAKNFTPQKRVNCDIFLANQQRKCIKY